MSYLSGLLTATRRRVAETRQKVTEQVLEERVAAAEPPRGFRAALEGNNVSLIAEIKRATPRAGDLNVDLDAASMANAYKEGGAAAISVLTEPDYFKGSLEDLQAARGAGLPVLLKDFVIDPFQVYEARAWGADAVLLIVRILGDELPELTQLIRSLSMDALVEVHDEADLDRALACDADLIGVNHRDLQTFEVDPDRTAKLVPRMPEGVTCVGLSGVSSRAKMGGLRDAGAAAVLVGESIVTAADPAAKIRELLGRS